MIKPGSRLATVAAHVPPDARLGDVGTDHALLPIYLARRGVIRSAIGTDVRPGPLGAGRRNVERWGLSSRIALRLGDGLMPIRRGEADVVTIAGMGGGLMLEILDPAREALAGTHTLVLQPQSGAGPLRRTMAARGWRLAAEELTAENGRIYTIMRWERGPGTDDGEARAAPDWAAGRRCPEVWAEYGPLLPAAAGPLFHRVLRDEIDRTRRAAVRLEKAGRAPAAPERLAELRRRINDWEEMEKWLASEN
ncbi:MAG: class I SAM-dependent methyltransferase [Gracilibacteraceae bacterium]|jgi:tRNA (adenine22-N1)-methyltransferase|nr:class I SAM-dependent methyltransferase [Gracilibacteraceae bacterium]